MKVNRKYSRFDYLLAIAIVILTCINTRQWQFYFAGRFNLGRFFLLFSLVYWLIILLIICCLVLMTKRILRHWRQLEMAGRLKGLLLVVFVISAVVFGLTRERATSPFGIAYLKGFRQRMMVQADIPAIRAWISELTANNIQPNVPRSSWTSSVRRLCAERVEYWTAEGLVVLAWDSAIVSWGLTVGPPSMQTPESRVGQYRMSMSEWSLSESVGAYVWFDEGK